MISEMLTVVFVFVTVIFVGGVSSDNCESNIRTLSQFCDDDFGVCCIQGSCTILSQTSELPSERKNRIKAG